MPHCLVSGSDVPNARATGERDADLIGINRPAPDSRYNGRGGAAPWLTREWALV